jgi:hypothetical protein
MVHVDAEKLVPGQARVKGRSKPFYGSCADPPRHVHDLRVVCQERLAATIPTAP